MDDSTEQHADRALLMDVMKVLAPKQRSVVVLRHWEQMSTEGDRRRPRHVGGNGQEHAAPGARPAP